MGNLPQMKSYTFFQNDYWINKLENKYANNRKFMRVFHHIILQCNNDFSRWREMEIHVAQAFDEWQEVMTVYTPPLPRDTHTHTHSIIWLKGGQVCRQTESHGGQPGASELAGLRQSESWGDKDGERQWVRQWRRHLCLDTGWKAQIELTEPLHTCPVGVTHPHISRLSPSTSPHSTLQ